MTEKTTPAPPRGAVQCADGDVVEVFSCHCSMCHRAGALQHVVPGADFRLLLNEDQLISCHVNKHIIDHNLCQTCGSKSFAMAGAATEASRARSTSAASMASTSPLSK